MFTLSTSNRFHLYSNATDMRKSFNGLSGIVTNELDHTPSNGDVFLFINKSRDKIKLLHWQSGGFVLYYKRLEQGRFDFPDYDANVASIGLDYTQLVLLIDGVSITNLHRKKRYKLPKKM